MSILRKESPFSSPDRRHEHPNGIIMKLSIIVPVYNTRDYLAACLDSILDPSLGDYEIIIVNDGSTDDSGTIASSYQRRFPSRVRVITTENGGIGAARNAGLEQARGDYLLFLDSDDCLEKGSLPEILSMLDGSFDIGLFDLLQVNSSGKIVGTLRGCGRTGTFTLVEYPGLLFELPSVCNKLIRRELFISSGIRFPGRVWFEDLRTVPKLYPLAGSIRVLSCPWYRYLIRSGSITNNANAARNLEIIDAVEEVLSFYRDDGLYDRYAAELCYMSFYNAFLTASVRVNSADPGSCVQDELMEWFLRSFPDWRSNPYVRDMSGKYRLLTWLLMHRMRRSVHLIMRVNDLVKNKKG